MSCSVNTASNFFPIAAAASRKWRVSSGPSRTAFAQPFSYGDAEQLDAVIRDTGLHAIDVQVSTMPIRLGANATDLLGYLSALPVGSEIAAMDDPARRAMLQEVLTALTLFVEAA